MLRQQRISIALWWTPSLWQPRVDKGFFLGQQPKNMCCLFFTQETCDDKGFFQPTTLWQQIFSIDKAVTTKRFSTHKAEMAVCLTMNSVKIVPTWRFPWNRGLWDNIPFFQATRLWWQRFLLQQTWFFQPRQLSTGPDFVSSPFRMSFRVCAHVEFCPNLASEPSGLIMSPKKQGKKISSGDKPPPETRKGRS